MKKLIMILMFFMLLLPSVNASTTVGYGDRQIVPADHPELIYMEFETKTPWGGGTYYKLSLGFNQKAPFFDLKGIDSLEYKIEYFVINGERIVPQYYTGASLLQGITYTKESTAWKGLPDDVEAVYELNFHDGLPQSINGKWYLQEIKFHNEAFDIVAGTGVEYATYTFEHNDLEKYPNIELNHGDVFKHQVGYVFVEPGFTAESTFDSDNVVDLTSDVVIEYGGITPGEAIEVEDVYIIRYSVTDSMGNVGFTERLVVIGAAELPVINEVIEEEETFTVKEPGVIATVFSGESFDLDRIIKDYWWVGVILAFLFVLFTTNSFVKSIAVAVVVLVLLIAVYGADLFDSRVLDFFIKSAEIIT